jgi:hypothetical protein
MLASETVVLFTVASLARSARHRGQIVIKPLMLPMASRTCYRITRIARAILQIYDAVGALSSKGAKGFNSHPMRRQREIWCNSGLMTAHA